MLKTEGINILTHTVIIQLMDFLTVHDSSWSSIDTHYTVHQVSLRELRVPAPPIHNGVGGAGTLRYAYRSIGGRTDTILRSHRQRGAGTLTHALYNHQYGACRFHHGVRHCESIQKWYSL